MWIEHDLADDYTAKDFVMPCQAELDACVAEYPDGDAGSGVGKYDVATACLPCPCVAGPCLLATCLCPTHGSPLAAHTPPG